jgi:hypothetical protein
MNSFIDSNPGLKSRFSKYLYFDDYTALELAAIFKEMAVRAQYVMSDEFSLLLDSTCQEIIAKKGEDFGNGRTMRNLFERCISNQANRLVSISNPTPDQLLEFVREDLLIEDIGIVMR